MDRVQKAEAVKSLNGLFANAGAVIVAHYTGMTVTQMGDLRLRLRKAGASFKVAKNRLAVRALEGTPAAGIAELFKGPTGIAFSDDPVAAPKVLVAYAKENAKFKIIGGFAVGYARARRIDSIRTGSKLWPNFRLWISFGASS